MNRYRIALLPGDGVGPELLNSVCRVLKETQKFTGGFDLEFVEYPIGKRALADEGAALPDRTLEGIRTADAALIGAISTGELPGPSPIGRMRKELNLFADVRPIKSFPGVWSLKPDIDLVCIRENTEGFLADRNLYKGYGELMPTADTVLSLRLLTRAGCERIARFAFDYARLHQRRRITAAHKANVLKTGCGFFLEIVREIGRDYPEIELKDEYVDNVMWPTI
jgi:3-isopropylmalate dehydrogenase